MQFQGPKVEHTDRAFQFGVLCVYWFIVLRYMIIQGDYFILLFSFVTYGRCSAACVDGRFEFATPVRRNR
jgi:hypothetical protein